MKYEEVWDNEGGHIFSCDSKEKKRKVQSIKSLKDVIIQGYIKLQIFYSTLFYSKKSE